MRGSSGEIYVRTFLEECRALGEFQRLERAYREAVRAERPVKAILRKAKSVLMRLNASGKTVS